jgi:hypothetical protein
MLFHLSSSPMFVHHVKSPGVKFSALLCSLKTPLIGPSPCLQKWDLTLAEILTTSFHASLVSVTFSEKVKVFIQPGNGIFQPDENINDVTTSPNQMTMPVLSSSQRITSILLSSKRARTLTVKNALFLCLFLTLFISAYFFKEAVRRYLHQSENHTTLHNRQRYCADFWGLFWVYIIRYRSEELLRFITFSACTILCCIENFIMAHVKSKHIKMLGDVFL